MLRLLTAGKDWRGASMLADPGCPSAGVWVDTGQLDKSERGGERRRAGVGVRRQRQTVGQRAAAAGAGK